MLLKSSFFKLALCGILSSIWWESSRIFFFSSQSLFFSSYWPVLFMFSVLLYLSLFFSSQLVVLSQIFWSSAVCFSLSTSSCFFFFFSLVFLIVLSPVIWFCLQSIFKDFLWLKVEDTGWTNQLLRIFQKPDHCLVSNSDLTLTTAAIQTLQKNLPLITLLSLQLIKSIQLSWKPQLKLLPYSLKTIIRYGKIESRIC